jgi:hypothetical protein
LGYWYDIYIKNKKEFGNKFIDLARNVYITNDERLEIKRENNLTFSSELVEEKDYQKYR